MKHLLLVCLLLNALRAAETSLTVDLAHSRIEYAVTATVDSFTGKLDAYSLDLAVDPAAVGGIHHATLRFHFSDLHSGNDKRDRQMHEWQDTPRFPEASFTLSALEPATTPGRFTARGQFIFHGITRELACPLAISNSTDGLWVIDGEARVDTRDFGLPIIRKFALLKVDPLVVVKLHLQARAAPAK